MSLIVEKIKEKIDIVSLIGTYVKLDKAGVSFKGKCPFHNEKTPSFFVSPDRGAYYCFGCHAKGDIFNFVQDFEGLDFIGAIKVLADRAGIDPEEFTGGGSSNKTEKDRLISIMEQTLLFFQKNLDQNDLALDYLSKRGLLKKTIDDWRVGFAPSGWRGLYEYLLSKNISLSDMQRCGLVKQKDDGSRVTYYDTFRGRIMFPIFDSSGRTIAFSGRIFVDDGKSAKYLNSPETELYNKSDTLYGLDKAKYVIRERDYSILVEGQMDIIMLHQAGFGNTVASSGTALTDKHLIKLKRLSNNIIMAFDGDDAGFSAISRSAKIALSLGMEVKVAKMPEGEDPASLALKDKEQLKDVIKNSKNIIFFILESIIDKNLDQRIVSKKWLAIFYLLWL
jgi:DNA primase